MTSKNSWNSSQMVQNTNSPERMVINGKVYMQVGYEAETPRNISITSNLLNKSVENLTSKQLTVHSSGDRNNQTNGTSKNNLVLHRNIRVRDWNVREEEEKEEVERIDDPSIKDVYGKEAEIVDTLKRKLQLKKQGNVDQETSLETNNVALRKNIIRQFGAMNVKKNGDSTKQSEATDMTTDTPAMVNIVHTSASKARISFSNFDKTKEVYLQQFKERTRPISEASPIKNQLENIYSTQANKRDIQEREIIFTTKQEDAEDIRKKEAAVKAMEKMFLRKKQESEKKLVQNEPNNFTSGVQMKITNQVPVPAKRQSLKKKVTEEDRVPTEFIQISKSSAREKPAIKMVEFSKSDTNYKNIIKKFDN